MTNISLIGYLMSKKNGSKRDRKKNKGKKGIESTHRMIMEDLFLITIVIIMLWKTAI